MSKRPRKRRRNKPTAYAPTPKSSPLWGGDFCLPLYVGAPGHPHARAFYTHVRVHTPPHRTHKAIVGGHVTSTQAHTIRVTAHETHRARCLHVHAYPRKTLARPSQPTTASYTWPSVTLHVHAWPHESRGSPSSNMEAHKSLNA